ncbi:MAG: SOS response-associated peptidase [Opitutaceae bacterium]
MCGRYTLITPEKILAERFVLDQVPSWSPRYNLGPTQEGLIVRRESTASGRTATRLRWGLIPHWTHRGSQPSILINARSETAADKPAFRDPFRHRRCLVLADGFIEWSRRSGEKMPYHFSMNDGRPFAMAGLWDRWQPDRDAAPVETYAILTTSANAVVEPFHDRMPAILDGEACEAWLDPYLVAPTPLTRLLHPFASSEIRGRPINPRVNSIRHDDPSCLEAPPPPPRPTRPPAAQLDLGI